MSTQAEVGVGAGAQVGAALGIEVGAGAQVGSEE
jgi:hypothetical protein